MDDCSWMYRDSPKRLIKMDYYNGIQGLLITHYLILEILVETVCRY